MKETAFLHHFIGKLHDDIAKAVGELSDEQLYYYPEGGVHAAFHAWHVIRTVDNVINFVCQDRTRPVWMRQNLHEEWSLPKAAQGTGMDLAQAQALRLPSNQEFQSYIAAVKSDVLGYFDAIDDDDLAVETEVKPFGVKPKLQHIGQTILSHGGTHLGQIKMLRTMQGLKGDEI